MPDYLVIARKYRPKSFQEVLGQNAIVTTLKNAIRRNCLAQAYLFCGARGTGKTTLARVFAKALNCQNPTADFEPCSQCSSCKEIASGSSLDILEIDGASHRGIDDIRQINETVGYASSSGKYKIYIIDEVHMLTKEAFNALLKTLEEPPPRVIFFFATTEPHKILPTILSRCQRFNLNRIPLMDMIHKLRQIANDLNVTIDDEALMMIVNRADGSLRDAESLFDQILTFHEGSISTTDVAAVLGMVPREAFFALDRAGHEGQVATAFEISHQVFSQGKDVGYFIECLMDHFRTILLVQLAGKTASFLSLSEGDRNKYEASAKLYSQEQCLQIIDFLVEVSAQSRFHASNRVALEAILLRILRSHQRISVEQLVRKLSDLEQRLTNGVVSAPIPKRPETIKKEIVSPPPPLVASVNEDPTPTPADLGIKLKPKLTPVNEKPIEVSMPVELGARLTPEAQVAAVKQQGRFDTLLQFAAVELEGTIQKQQR